MYGTVCIGHKYNLHTHMHTHTHSQFSFFALVLFCDASANTEVANMELVLR